MYNMLLQISSEIDTIKTSLSQSKKIKHKVKIHLTLSGDRRSRGSSTNNPNLIEVDQESEEVTANGVGQRQDPGITTQKPEENK